MGEGLQENSETASAGSAAFYPPYNWIPACAGMTKEGQRSRVCRGAGGAGSFASLPICRGFGGVPNSEIPLNPPLPKWDR